MNQTTQTQIGDGSPSKNTLVQLMEWSHIEYMMGRLSSWKHQELYQSWHKITKSFYESLEEED